VDHRHRRAPGRVLLHLDLVTLLSWQKKIDWLWSTWTMDPK
jgi:hypothetical protein